MTHHFISIEYFILDYFYHIYANMRLSLKVAHCDNCKYRVKQEHDNSNLKNIRNGKK